MQHVGATDRVKVRIVSGGENRSKFGQLRTLGPVAGTKSDQSVACTTIHTCSRFLVAVCVIHSTKLPVLEIIERP